MRIVIYGRPGSGKSTTALALSKKLGLPLHHLDKYFFIEHWAKRDYADFLAIQKNLVDQEAWIIEGCSLQSLEMRYARADVCIFFLYPRWRCLWRLFKRMFVKDPEIQDRAPKCRETISWELIKYTWTFEYRLDHRLHKQLDMLRTKYPHVVFYTVKNDADVRKVVQKLCKT